MRIVGGSHRSRRLAAPPGDATRPTSDRVREALFSILGTTTQDARVLDLFAGSGALGLEALSRGAQHATFVDDAPGAIAAIRRNLDTLDLADRATVRKADAIRYLRTRADGATAAGGDHYDLVFLDPPYAHAQRFGAELDPMLSSLPQFAGATIVTESDRRRPLQLDLPLGDERRYGDTLIRIHAR